MSPARVKATLSRFEFRSKLKPTFGVSLKTLPTLVLAMLGIEGEFHSTDPLSFGGTAYGDGPDETPSLLGTTIQF
jgi:hypothetical protein